MSNINIADVTNTNYVRDMFKDCTLLSDASLDSILVMCSTFKKSVSYKALKRLGITDENLTSRVPNLPHYQDFLDAGWTISY